MCEVCEIKGWDVRLLAPFLREGVRIKFDRDEDGYEEITLIDPSGSLVTVTADCDQGPSFFHFSYQRG